MITALIIHWTFREAFACTAAEHYQQYNLLIINALFHRLWDCSSVVTIVGNHEAKRKVERWPRVLKIVWRMMMMMMKQRDMAGWLCWAVLTMTQSSPGVNTINTSSSTSSTNTSVHHCPQHEENTVDHWSCVAGTQHCPGQSQGKAEGQVQDQEEYRRGLWEAEGEHL